MKENTSTRLKRLMRERGLRQVDILEKVKPFCKEFNVKLGKSDISQYVSGKVTPGQDKLSMLGMALDVSETWLMGYDVPIERNESTIKRLTAYANAFNLNEQKILLLYNKLNDSGKLVAIERIEELTYIPKYCNDTPDYIKPTAAHERTDSTQSKADIKHDLDIMDEKDF